MAWKPKEKPLTKEEAIEIARRDLAPLWLGSEPLLAGTRNESGACFLYPLDAAFSSRPWLFVFVDLMDFETEAVLESAREWSRRYTSHGLGILVIVRPTYDFIKSAHDLVGLVKKNSDYFPIVLDQGRFLQDSIAVACELPVVCLLDGAKNLFLKTGKNWSTHTENEIQSFIRKKDPGLPLARPYLSAQRVELGVGRFEFVQKSNLDGIKINGTVIREEERLVIKDPLASIQFKCPDSKMSLIAVSALSVDQPTRIRVDLNGETVFEQAAAQDIVYADDGGADVKIGVARLYHILRALPEKTREVTLRFPDADRLPVGIYGIRF